MAELLRSAPKVLAVEFRPSAIQERWNQGRELTGQFIETIRKVSRDRLAFQLVNFVDTREYPSFLDGRQYTDTTYAEVLADDKLALRDANGGYMLANYEQIIQKFEILQKVESEEIDEVWMFGGPYFGFYESRMVGKSAYWCNGPAIEMDSRRFIMMGFNYERSVKEMVHDFGHRAESILARHFSSETYLRKMYRQQSTPAPSNAYEQFLVDHGTVHRKPGGEEFSQDESAWLSEFELGWFDLVADPNLESDVTAPISQDSPVSPILNILEVDKTPNALSDRPSGQDQLNYSQYAKAFAKIVLNKETKTPLTVGIYGQWGQGKSFLMGKIQDALSEETKKNKGKPDVVYYRVVNFNAWTYVGTDHLWAGLVSSLYQHAEKFLGWRLHMQRLWQAIRKSLPKSLAVFAFYAILGLGLSFLLNYQKITQSGKELMDAVRAFGISVLGGSALAGIPLLWTTLTEFLNNLFLSRSKNLQNLAAKPDFRAQIGIMPDIKNEIRFISNELRRYKGGRGARFILFIDDLDRCEYRKAVEVLQAIMLLLADEDASQFVIFLGIDARVIVSAIEENYGTVLVKAGINGYEYLDKIVQIPFEIPPPPDPDLLRYLQSMLMSSDEEQAFGSEENGHDTTRPSNEDDTSTDGEISASREGQKEVPVTLKEEERKALEDCVKELSDNPRKIKRIVNIYRFARQILSEEQDRTNAIHWFVMTERWPLHIAWIMEYIENDQQTVNQLAKKNLLDVYELAKNDIHSKEMDKLLTIDADPELFEAFIKRKIFTVEEIVKLIPSTFNLNPAIRSQVRKQAVRKTEIGVLNVNPRTRIRKRNLKPV